MSFLLGMNNFQLNRALNQHHDVLCSRTIFLNILIQLKVEKEVDVSYLHDKVMFLLADSSFSLGTALFKTN